MTEDELSKIEARANAATPGPWTFLPDQRLERRGLGILGPSFERVALMPEPAGAHPVDALFVAHARTDVPALVAEVRRLRLALHIAVDGWEIAATTIPGDDRAESRERERLRGMLGGASRAELEDAAGVRRDPWSPFV